MRASSSGKLSAHTCPKWPLACSLTVVEDWLLFEKATVHAS
jgi:hypothetical protein